MTNCIKSFLKWHKGDRERVKHTHTGIQPNDNERNQMQRINFNDFSFLYFCMRLSCVRVI